MFAFDSLNLEPSEIKELFTTGHWIESCRDIPIFCDVDQDLESFEVIKLDSVRLKSNLNYLWNDQLDFLNGVYMATISESEF